jgi:hypothetical protein
VPSSSAAPLPVPLPVPVNETTITTDEGTSKKAEETRMKNTAGQWYILAKVLI